MKDRVNRQPEAFRQALWYCRHYGLDWRNHIEPKITNGEIAGYYILDETFSTTVAVVDI